jgi:hypothetical protein
MLSMIAKEAPNEKNHLSNIKDNNIIEASHTLSLSEQRVLLDKDNKGKE